MGELLTEMECCECKITKDYDAIHKTFVYGIKYCAQHSAAPDLVEALRLISHGSLEGMRVWLIAHGVERGIAGCDRLDLIYAIADTVLLGK